jgi:protein TonB
LLNLHRQPTVRAEATSVAVRLVADSVERPQWQPPQVTPVVPVVQTQLPDAPSMDSPVAVVESTHAITAAAASPPAVQPAKQSGDVARLVASVEYVREPEPRYPPQSRKLREQGLVVLRVMIDERGDACDVQIETSSGHERLDAAAREAIARAEFRPYVEDGVARRAVVLIPIEFSLSRNPARVAANGA